MPLLAEIVEDTKDLSTLESLLETAGLLDVFTSLPLGWTVLAPDNHAFEDLAKYDPVFYKALATKPWVLHLAWLLLFHVVEAEVKSTDLSDGLEVEVYTEEVSRLVDELS